MRFIIINWIALALILIGCVIKGRADNLDMLFFVANAFLISIDLASRKVG